MPLRRTTHSVDIGTSIRFWPVAALLIGSNQPGAAFQVCLTRLSDSGDIPAIHRTFGHFTENAEAACGSPVVGEWQGPNRCYFRKSYRYEMMA